MKIAPCHENILRSSPDFQYRVKNYNFSIFFSAGKNIHEHEITTNTVTKNSER